MTVQAVPGVLAPHASRRCLALTFAVGVVLTTSTAAISAVPDLRFAGWPWTLVCVAALSVGLALPVHRLTMVELRDGRFGPAGLGSLGLAVALVATVVEARTDGAATTSTAVVASAGLLSLVARWRGTESILDAPSWSSAAVVLAAVAAGVGWSVVESPARGLVVAALVLVAAGPGGLLAAGPAALRTARRRVVRDDVTLPHAAALSEVAEADVAVLEKDGTLTTGALRVSAVVPVEPDHDRNLRWFAGALAHEQEGRVAHAVSRLSARGRVTDVQCHEDAGLSGRVDRHPVRVGRPEWLGLVPPTSTWTVLGVEVDGRALGTLTVADDVREDAAAGVQALRDLGLDVVVRSTDTDARTREVASRVGVDDAVGDVDPDAQHATVVAWRRDGRHVLHVSPRSGLAADLGLPDLDPRRVARALGAARRAVTSARRAAVVAAVWAVAASVAAAAGALGPGLASSAAGLGVALSVLSARV